MKTTVKQLIEKLQELPEDMEVVLFDHKMNLHHASSDPTPEGIYSKFDLEKVELYGLEDNKPFEVAAFTFDNHWDYDDEGRNYHQEDLRSGGDGVLKILNERFEQLNKHGRTVEDDVKYNDFNQLRHGAIMLLDGYVHQEEELRPPFKWDEAIWNKMANKPMIERLAIAGALIAAEIDRQEAVDEQG